MVYCSVYNTDEEMHQSAGGCVSFARRLRPEITVSAGSVPGQLFARGLVLIASHDPDVSDESPRESDASFTLSLLSVSALLKTPLIFGSSKSPVGLDGSVHVLAVTTDIPKG